MFSDVSKRTRSPFLPVHSICAILAKSFSVSYVFSSKSGENITFPAGTFKFGEQWQLHGPKSLYTSSPKDHKINKRANTITRPKPFSIIRDREYHRRQITCAWRNKHQFPVQLLLLLWCCWKPVSVKSGEALWKGEQGHRDEVQTKSPAKGERSSCTKSSHTTHRPESWQFSVPATCWERAWMWERDPGLREVLLLDEKEIKEGVMPSQWGTLEGAIKDTATPQTLTVHHHHHHHPLKKLPLWQKWEFLNQETHPRNA